LNPPVSGHEVELATLKVVKQLDPRKFVAGRNLLRWSFRAAKNPQKIVDFPAMELFCRGSVDKF